MTAEDFVHQSEFGFDHLNVGGFCFNPLRVLRQYLIDKQQVVHSQSRTRALHNDY